MAYCIDTVLWQRNHLCWITMDDYATLNDWAGFVAIAF